jgi:hypothetical protein
MKAKVAGFLALCLFLLWVSVSPAQAFTLVDGNSSLLWDEANAVTYDWFIDAFEGLGGRGIFIV